MVSAAMPADFFVVRTGMLKRREWSWSEVEAAGGGRAVHADQSLSRPTTALYDKVRETT